MTNLFYKGVIAEKATMLSLNNRFFFEWNRRVKPIFSATASAFFDKA